MMDKLFRKKEQPDAGKTSQSATPATPATPSARPAARPQGQSAAATAAGTPTSRSFQGAGGNVERWRRSGKPQAWVEKHNFQWNHENWLQLLRDLERSEFWPMKPEEVGAVLEALKAEHARFETVGT